MPTFAPTFLNFEQDRLNDLAAKARIVAAEAAATAREAAIARARREMERKATQDKLQSEKSTRRHIREGKARDKAKIACYSAQCGIRHYSGGSGWTHCFDCKQPLIYRLSEETFANPQICRPVQAPTVNKP